MIPPPPPLIIEKDGFRLVFNEPMEKGCVSIGNGTGGMSIYLDEDQLMLLAGAALAASRRIRKNRAGAMMRGQDVTCPKALP